MSRRSAAALAIGLLLLAVSCWTAVPAPAYPMLLLAVGVPELAPYALALALPLSLVALRLARGRARGVVAGLAVAANACLLWPAFAAPFAAAAAQRTLDDARIPSARTRALGGVDVVRDLPVPLRDGKALALDLYRPHHARGASPLIVAIYGGSWSRGSRTRMEALARWYAHRGYAVAAIDYRHAPQYRFPVQRDDVEDAFRAIAAHARAWRVDPAHVALFGRSAGAELALLAAERPQPLRVAAVVAYYAPVDLTGGWNDPPQPDPAGVRGILAAYLGGPPDAAHATAYRAASPFDGAHAGMPPALLISGRRDQLVLIRFSRAFAARLRQLRVPVAAIELPWANHGFDEVDGIGAAIARDATLRFLDGTLS